MTEITNPTRPQLRRLTTRSDEEAVYVPTAWTTPAQLDPPAPFPFRYPNDEGDDEPVTRPARSPLDILISDAIFVFVWACVFLIGGAFLVAAILAFRWVV